MTRKNSGQRDGKDEEANTERSLFTRLVESVIVFVICCFLVKQGVSYLISVRIPLIIISVILVTIVIIYRVCKRRSHDDY